MIIDARGLTPNVTAFRKSIAAYLVKTEDDDDILEITLIENSFVLSGVNPPRFIKKSVEVMDLERFVLDSDLYEILEVERYV